MIAPGAEVGKFPYFGPLFFVGSQLDDVLIVLFVHGQDEIEYLKIPQAKLPGVSGHLVAAPPDCFGHADIGFVARVHSDGSGGIAVDLVGKTSLPDHVPEDVLASRRTADISHTNEEQIVAAFHKTDVRVRLVDLTGEQS